MKKLLLVRWPSSTNQIKEITKIKKSDLNKKIRFKSKKSDFLKKSWFLSTLPFSSHCSTQNIGFSDSGYVIKTPHPSSAIYEAPPFAGKYEVGI